MNFTIVCVVSSSMGKLVFFSLLSRLLWSSSCRYRRRRGRQLDTREGKRLSDGSLPVRTDNRQSSRASFGRFNCKLREFRPPLIWFEQRPMQSRTPRRGQRMSSNRTEIISGSYRKPSSANYRHPPSCCSTQAVYVVNSLCKESTSHL